MVHPSAAGKMMFGPPISVHEEMQKSDFYFVRRPRLCLSTLLDSPPPPMRILRPLKSTPLRFPSGTSCFEMHDMTGQSAFILPPLNQLNKRGIVLMSELRISARCEIRWICLTRHCSSGVCVALGTLPGNHHERRCDRWK